MLWGTEAKGRGKLKTLLLTLAGALFSISLYAQGQAQIQGAVLDSTGSAVPGAEVKATQTETGAVRTTTSTADGRYVLPNLPIGPYRMEVSKTGFSAYVQSGITLQVNTNPTIDIALKVGNVSEQVQVEANAALVETQATGIGTVIENRRILELPLNGRVATDLIQLAGGVIPQGVAGNGGFPGTQQYVINGGQSFGDAFWLDGSVFNNPWDNANIPFPFPDALQEFKVETSALTAQNGVHAGGSITAVTKSGTNSFHGDAFEFLRNGDLNGTNWSTSTNDGLKRNQYGGVVGGPVKKDKIFFFFGYQGTKTRQTSFTNDFIPTPAMLTGDFSACPQDVTSLTVAQKALFTGNKVDPKRYDPASLKLANKLPVVTNGCGLLPVGLVTQVNEGQYVARGDYQTSAKNTVFGRYLRTTYFRPPSLTLTPANILSSTQGGLSDADQTWTAGDTYLFSSSMVNQFRASVLRQGIHRFDSDFVDSCDLGVPVYCGYVPHQSSFAVTGNFTVGPGTGGQAKAHVTTYQMNDDMSWVHGAHQVNFGVGGAMYNMNFLGNVYAQNSWNFGNLPSFLLGTFNTFSMSAPNPLVQVKWFLNGYVQDTWKATSRLTVNIGLRWEPSLPPQALNKAAYNFNYQNMINNVHSTVFVNGPPGMMFPGDPGVPNGLAAVNKQWNLFAPRIAIGYDPTGTGKMTIRASYGIAYDYVNGSMYVNSADSPPFGNTSIVTGGQFSNPYANLPNANIFPYSLNSTSPFAPGGTYIAEDPNMKTTVVHQWNAVIQRQFGNNWVASATYTGSETEHLLASYQVNPGVIVPCPGGAALTSCNTTGNTQNRRLFTVNNFPGNQYYADIDVMDTGGTSSYNGMILAIQKRLSKGLSTNANYTWSHCIGDLTWGNSTGNAGAGFVIPNNRRYDRSNCQSVEIGGTFSSDRRHLFNWTTVYETPKFGNRTTNILASGWKISGIYRAQSAPLLTVALTSDVSLTGAAAGSQRPNFLGGSPLCANPRPTCWIDPTKFALPAPGTFGNLGRSNIPGPAFWQVDMALSRVFAIKEGYTLEFRAEAFNLPNSRRAGIAPPSLQAGGSGVNLSFGTAPFGTITSSLDPRIMQMALKFVF
jgi:hypothetical protein